MQDKLRLDLIELDSQYEQITGHNAFLYVEPTSSGPGAYHFTQDRVVYGVRSALAHMKWLLRKAAEEMEESAVKPEAWVYAHTGWSVHSGAGGARTWWLACYASGKQVATHDTGGGRLIRYGSHDAAWRVAVRLNAELGIVKP